jgi:hypothetical protein
MLTAAETDILPTKSGGLNTAPISLFAAGQLELRRIEVRHGVEPPHLLLPVRANIVENALQCDEASAISIFRS